MRIKLIKLKSNIINRNDTCMNTGNYFFTENENNSCNCFVTEIENNSCICFDFIKAIAVIFTQVKKRNDTKNDTFGIMRNIIKIKNLTQLNSVNDTKLIPF